MPRIALVLSVLAAAAWLLCWPVTDQTLSTLIGWTGGPDPNGHTRTIQAGRPYRWLTLEHNWNLRQGTDSWQRRIEVKWLLADSAIALGVPLAAWLAVRSWRATRRRTQGACATCGYDLTGNQSGTCPECGTAVQSLP